MVYPAINGPANSKVWFERRALAGSLSVTKYCTFSSGFIKIAHDEPTPCAAPYQTTVCANTLFKNGFSSSSVLMHNHPSGDPAPSRADIDITRRVAEAGKRLGISLHDHVIIAASGHSSLRAMGLL